VHEADNSSCQVLAVHGGILKGTNRFYDMPEKLSPGSKNRATEFARTRYVSG